MKSGIIILIVLALILALGGCQFVQQRNKLASERETIRAEWSQVDADLQRRADLIPNLVETVKGYAKEETTVVQSVADARAALVGAKSPQEKIDANSQLTGALGRLLVVVENYPNLKANENFMQLQDELAGTENRILQAAAPLQRSCAEIQYPPLSVSREHRGLDVRVPAQRCLLQDRAGRAHRAESKF